MGASVEPTTMLPTEESIFLDVQQLAGRRSSSGSARIEMEDGHMWRCRVEGSGQALSQMFLSRWTFSTSPLGEITSRE